MSLSASFFEKLQELEAQNGLTKSASITEAQTIELYPNKYEELSVDQPFYLENAILSTAAAEEYNPMDAKQIKLLKEKKHPVKAEDLIEKAHPKSIYLSNALGDGGLVENQNEQHEKMMQVVHKLPTGNHIHLYAEVMSELVKIANDLEDKSPEAAAKVDEAIATLAGRESDRLSKEAIFPLVPVLIGAGILAGVSALGAGVWNAIKGIQEGLVEDTQQLVSNLEGWKDDEKYAAQKPILDKMYSTATRLNAKVSALMSQSSQLVITPTPELEQSVSQIDKEFGDGLKQINALTGVLKARLGSFDFITSFEGKLQDVNEQFATLHSQIAQMAAHAAQVSGQPGDPGADGTQGTAKQVAIPSDPDRVLNIQKYLISVGFGPLAETGKADAATKAKLVDFEKYLNETEEIDGKQKVGLGVGNLPGNRLEKLLDTTLTSTQLLELVKLFQNPAGALTE